MDSTADWVTATLRLAALATALGAGREPVDERAQRVRRCGDAVVEVEASNGHLEVSRKQRDQ